MIIPCFRCGKDIESPNQRNADYVIAKDTRTKEPREVFVALTHNKQTRAKKEKLKKDRKEQEGMDATEEYLRSHFQDDEYDAVDVPDVATAISKFGEDLVKVIVVVRLVEIQKTGIICPDCWKPADFVIWGVHENHEA